MAQTVKYGERSHAELASDEIMEETIYVQDGNRHINKVICDFCFIQTLSSVGTNIALYLCYMCDKYLCQDCFIGHESHSFIKKKKKDGKIESFLEEMINEKKRDEIFEKEEEVSVVDNVNVKHEIDQWDCHITGLCGLNYTRLVVCDCCNECIKIFSVGSNILQRYIRFGSEPSDVTEIKVKREPTKQTVMSASDISVTNRKEPDKQYMLAVTLQSSHRILFINVTKKPAVITKSIKAEKPCSIDFSNDNIFTLCCGDLWFVSVISTEGFKLKTINIDLHPFSFPYLAVCLERIYITDPRSNKVLCMNHEGKVISHKTIEGSWPEGISVDPDTNQVYIYAWSHTKLYRLDSCLESFESLLDLKLVGGVGSEALCLFRDKLFIGHCPWSTHRNFITVVRVL